MPFHALGHLGSTCSVPTPARLRTALFWSSVGQTRAGRKLDALLGSLALWLCGSSAFIWWIRVGGSGFSSAGGVWHALGTLLPARVLR